MGRANHSNHTHVPLQVAALFASVFDGFGQYEISFFQEGSPEVAFDGRFFHERFVSHVFDGRIGALAHFSQIGSDDGFMATFPEHALQSFHGFSCIVASCPFCSFDELFILAAFGFERGRAVALPTVCFLPLFFHGFRLGWRWVGHLRMVVLQLLPFLRGHVHGPTTCSQSLQRDAGRSISQHHHGTCFFRCTVGRSQFPTWFCTKHGSCTEMDQPGGVSFRSRLCPSLQHVHAALRHLATVHPPRLALQERTQTMCVQLQHHGIGADSSALPSHRPRRIFC
mmetsp:Transcript_1995/g.12703  ORF Transcript_1995/g.12703 Transcript_1995/m.12703 type:complete len:282 (-) Transcript_1995:3227-4072(-)